MQKAVSDHKPAIAATIRQVVQKMFVILPCGHTQASEGINVGDEVKEGNEIGESDGSGTNEPHQHYTYRPGTVEAPATTDTTPVDPITTQFEDKPDSEVCEKGSKSC